MLPPFAASGAAVFFAGGDATPNMALGFVDVQDLLDLQVQRPVELGQPFGDIFMHGSYKVER